MLDKVGKFVRRIFLILILLCIVIYLSVAFFYKKVFMVNTWINGVYCTGKTVEEVNTELLYDAKAPFLTITNSAGETAEIDLSEVSYEEDYTEGLRNYIREQNSLLWIKYLNEEQHVELAPAQNWNDEALRARILELDMVKKEQSESTDVLIQFGEMGYELQDGTRKVFQPEIFADYVVKRLKMGIYSSDLAESNAYENLEYTQEQLETLDEWSKVQEFLQCNIVYDMGDAMIPLDSRITSSFVETDENGEFVWDENGKLKLKEAGIEAFVEQLASEYDTCKTELAFEATRGEVVKVPYVTYGTKLDTEAEIAYLEEAFLQKVEEVHVPKYLQEGYVRGKDDIGNTYIEVDMTNQKLYCYKEGELILETDIVTGNMKRKWGTPSGVNYVYSKQKNRILRGEGYASPVDYWMPVKGNIGIHDADWRKEFGGEIYKTSGSHGCINIPPENMPIIYEEYEIGTPVIMFY